jgi:phosphate transport system substrate-binding protein
MKKLTVIFTCLILGFSVHAKEAAPPADNDQALKWVGCGITKKAFMAELAKGFEKKSGVKIEIQGGGATKGIRKVADGEADLGGACRYKIDGAREEFRAILEPVAWDALAVIVHPDNPVTDISLDQIRGIYLGKITNWKELGGKDAPIRVLARQGKISGVGRAVRKLVFANFAQDFKATEFMKSSGPLEKAVEKDVNAIGITGISSARKRNVKNLTLEGKEPSFDNIRNGQYLLYRPLYIVVSTDGKKRQEIKDFLTYMHSAEGKEIIRNNGTVPYLDAVHLVMKQVKQEERAAEQGLYR